jgi:hypothetical protein
MTATTNLTPKESRYRAVAKKGTLSIGEVPDGQPLRL